MIETGVIKMAPKKMLQTLFLQYGRPWALGAVCGIVVFVVLGCTLDYRFFILALIWIFMVIPLATAFLYFYYGMDPLTAFNAIPHKIRFSEEKVTVELESLEPSEEEGEPTSLKTYVVNTLEFRQMKSTLDGLILSFGKKGWLWLPISSLSSPDDMQATIALLSQTKK